MAFPGPWVSDFTTQSGDGRFRLEIWDTTRTTFIPAGVRVTRLNLPRRTPVLALRRRLQHSHHIPIEYQILRIAYPARSPPVIQPQENNHALEEVGLGEFSLLTLHQTETRVRPSDSWRAVSPSFYDVLITLLLALSFSLLKLWSGYQAVASWFRRGLR